MPDKTTMTGPEAAAYYSKLVAERANRRCGAGLEFVHGGKRTMHAWLCTLPLGHAGMHCTPSDSEWMATPPRE